MQLKRMPTDNQIAEIKSLALELLICLMDAGLNTEAQVHIANLNHIFHPEKQVITAFIKEPV